jgi:hypothetical protein
MGEINLTHLVSMLRNGNWHLEEIQQVAKVSKGLSLHLS